MLFFSNYLKFFKFVKKLENNKINFILSNLLNNKILFIFSGNNYKIFYLKVNEGMANSKKKRLEILICFFL